MHDSRYSPTTNIDFVKSLAKFPTHPTPLKKKTKQNKTNKKHPRHVNRKIKRKTEIYKKTKLRRPHLFQRN